MNISDFFKYRCNIMGKKNNMWSGVADGLMSKRIWRFAIASASTPTSTNDGNNSTANYQAGYSALGIQPPVPPTPTPPVTYWHQIATMVPVGGIITSICNIFPGSLAVIWDTTSSSHGINDGEHTAIINQPVIMGYTDGYLLFGTIGHNASAQLIYPAVNGLDSISTTISGVSMDAINTIQAVGSYANSNSEFYMGYIYTGVISNVTVNPNEGSHFTMTSPIYSTLSQPPSNFVPNVTSVTYQTNYPRSISGNIVVGSWTTQAQPNSSIVASYIYIISSQTYVYVQYPGALTTTPYGVCSNGNNSYTICGGCSQTITNGYLFAPYGNAFIVDYNSSTGVFSNWTNFSAGSNPYMYSSICVDPQNSNNYMVGAITSNVSQPSATVTLVRNTTSAIFQVSKTAIIQQSGVFINGVLLDKAVGAYNNEEGESSEAISYIYY